MSVMSTLIYALRIAAPRFSGTPSDTHCSGQRANHSVMTHPTKNGLALFVCCMVIYIVTYIVRYRYKTVNFHIKTSHNSLVRVRYEVSFVHSGSDLYLLFCTAVKRHLTIYIYIHIYIYIYTSLSPVTDITIRKAFKPQTTSWKWVLLPCFHNTCFSTLQVDNDKGRSYDSTLWWSIFRKLCPKSYLHCWALQVTIHPTSGISQERDSTPRRLVSVYPRRATHVLFTKWTRQVRMQIQ